VGVVTIAGLTAAYLLWPWRGRMRNRG